MVKQSQARVLSLRQTQITLIHDVDTCMAPQQLSQVI